MYVVMIEISEYCVTLHNVSKKLKDTSCIMNEIFSGFSTISGRPDFIET